MLASQYRGVDGGEGIEEFGGADVHDITNLVPLARGLGGIDLDNVFMLGWSRGAMSTFLALKQGMKVNAVAVGGGLLDLLAEAKRRPAVAARVWSELMPGYASRRDEVLRERSVMYWPEQITAPVLILHGGGDWRASPAEALTLAQKLQAAGKPYELIDLCERRSRRQRQRRRSQSPDRRVVPQTHALNFRSYRVGRGPYLKTEQRRQRRKRKSKLVFLFRFLRFLRCSVFEIRYPSTSAP